MCCIYNSSPQEVRSNERIQSHWAFGSVIVLENRATILISLGFQAANTANTEQTQPWKSNSHTFPTSRSVNMEVCSTARGANLFLLIYETNKWSPTRLPPLSHLSCSASLLQPVTCWMLTDDAPRSPTWGTHITFSSCCH